MTRVLLAPASPLVESLVREATGGGHLALPPGPLATDANQLFAFVAATGLPDVVVVDTTTVGIEPALALSASIDHWFPGITTVLFSDRAVELGLAALRVGVRDILPLEVTADRVRIVFDRAGAAARARRIAHLPQSAAAPQPAAPADRHGQVISVLSPKGGAGRTSIATNLALGLVRTTAMPTVLVDLDLQFGDVALTLDLAPEYGLPDAISGRGTLDSMLLKTFLTKHSSGLYVLPGASAPEAADAVRAEDIGQLLTVLAGEFRYVVVDTAAGLTEHTLAAVEKSHDLVFVAPSDVPGLRALRTGMQTLVALDLMSSTRHVVHNDAHRRTGLTRSDVESTLEHEVHVEIPRSWGMIAAMNQGAPLLLGRSSDPAAKALQQLVRRFVPAPTRTGRPR
ncbi:pilus assembly protein CpaE [Brachybacterium vulturis]|uniref:Pilus assembly protein CpaE n=1 Tax=Brachybacterium vulturis TaxID=2017484 RepID=A0A291GPG6_9MICO|nr:pilus assembly protein CpaE [Brachybacterium vulturis]ATG51864.1 pilus assembly protein CpaE [Brachybacterium vulturis]